MQRQSKFDFDEHMRSDSEGLLNSPLLDISVIDASFNLKDEREIMRDKEDKQQSVQFVVETGMSANERTGTVNILISRFL